MFIETLCFGHYNLITYVYRINSENQTHRDKAFITSLTTIEVVSSCNSLILVFSIEIILYFRVSPFPHFPFWFPHFYTYKIAFIILQYQFNHHKAYHIILLPTKINKFGNNQFRTHFYISRVGFVDIPSSMYK